MSVTVEQILEALSGLGEPDFDVHTIDDAWYSARSIARAFSGKNFEHLPEIKVVRVGLERRGGVLELHPNDNDSADAIPCVRILCYCCFSGKQEKGLVQLSQLKGAIEALVDHHCPPWPG